MELEPVGVARSQDYLCGKAKKRFKIGTGSEAAQEPRGGKGVRETQEVEWGQGPEVGPGA